MQINEDTKEISEVKSGSRKPVSYMWGGFIFTPTHCVLSHTRVVKLSPQGSRVKISSSRELHAKRL